MGQTEAFYRNTTAAGASGLGMMIALYDTLAGDLRGAAEAERSNDLTERTRKLNHALLVLGFLEDKMQNGNGGELARMLAAFYVRLRRRIVEAQVKRSPAILEQEMEQVLKVRARWQQIEMRSVAVTEAARPPEVVGYSGSTGSTEPRKSMSWSA